MTTFPLDSDINEIVDSLSPELRAAFSGKHILITGGCGFLGRYFTATFERLNDWFGHADVAQCKIVVLDNLITSGACTSPQISNNVKFIQHDIITPIVLSEPFDYIFHAAGIASPYYYRKYPLQTLEVATKGLQNILELAKCSPGVKLSFFSSSEIYGDPDPKYIPTPESYKGNVSCLGPRSSYDESKRLGETLVRIYYEQSGVHGTIIRPFNIFGPGSHKTDYRVLPNFAARIVTDEPLHVYGDGKQTRTFCYITDAIRGFLQVLVNGVAGEPYNIGNPEPEISMLDLALLVHKIVRETGKSVTVDYPDSYPADEPNRRCPDITKARTQLGYEPKISLEEGLRRFFGWADKAYRE